MVREEGAAVRKRKRKQGGVDIGEGRREGRLGKRGEARVRGSRVGRQGRGGGGGWW